MEYLEVPKEIKVILDKPLPEASLSKHPTKTYLTSIKAIYVTERMTEAFGVGGWKTRVEQIGEVVDGMVVVKTTFEVPKYGIYYECFGGNDNGGEKNKNFDLGDAYKGATTDALTKIGSYLGIGIDVFKGNRKSGNNNYKPNPPKPIEPPKTITKEEIENNLKKAKDLKELGSVWNSLTKEQKDLVKELKDRLKLIFEGEKN